mgnify:CR=1 FL=1
MSSLEPEMEDSLHPENSISSLQELFSQTEAHRYEEMGTFLLLKALQPLFTTHPNFMDREFASAVERHCDHLVWSPLIGSDISPGIRHS